MQQTHRIRRFRRAAGLLALSCFAASGLWAQSTIRINCGGASSTFTGSDGQQWLTDRYYSGSDMRYTSSPVGNTPDQYLYRTARAGLYSDFQYNIPVANGSYNLTLKFAEIQYTSRGQRVFNVKVNGVTVLNHFDIMAEVPALTALDKTFPVTATNGNIKLQFAGVTGRGIVNAIKVEPSASQPVTVSVNPAQVSLGAGQTATFQATVGGTTNTAVTWTATAGTIAANGVYTAPSSISQAGTATVTATSAANSQISATATVNLVTPVKVAVSPATASVASGGKAQFTASVTGTSDARVTWTATAGTVDSTGLFTAPSVTAAATATVKAVSVADTTASSTAQVSIAAPAGTATSAYSEVGGVVSLEAEDGTIINRSGKLWTPSTSSWNYSGNGFLLPSPTTGTVFDPNYVGVAPEVQFQVNFQTIGTYAVWVRGAGTNVHVGLDGAAVATASQIGNFIADWGWSHTRMDGSFATLTIASPGVHTVNVWMRDDAFWFDKIVLAQTAGFTPSGTGPAESALAPVTTSTTTTAPPAPTTTTTTTTTTTPTTTTASGPYYAAANGIVSLEAEDGKIINRSGKQWTVSSASWNYSGNGFLLPSPTTGTVFDPNYVGVAPEVQFQVNFQTAGAYAVWVRGAGTNVHVGLDGAAVATASQIANFTADWGWSHTRMDGSYATLNIASAGVHTVNVWMRDDAFWFDKIVLAQTSGYVPSGTGPAESTLVGSTSGTTATTSGSTTTTTTPPPTSTTTGASAGRVSLMKLTNPSYDQYILSPTTTMEQFELQHIQRMVAFSPTFNGPSSWYPSGLIYADSYAIYSGGTFGEDVVSTHPEWILKDASGNRLYIPWGCSGGTCPQYAADFSNPNFRQWWIGKVKAELTQGTYKGVFIDDVNFDWRISDGWGNTVTPWDPNTNAPMTIDNWRLYFAQFLEAVRQGLSGYEICHNSIWYAGGDSGRDSNPYIQRQIAAADDVFIEFGINDGGLTGGTGPWSVDAVLSYIERLNALGKHMVLAGLAAGSSTDRVGLEFGVAGYLLVNNGSDYAADGYNMVIDPGNWWPGFNVDLGTPSGSRYSWNGLMRRDFSGGMVLLNDPSGSTVTVPLPGTFKRVDGTSVTSVTLGARQAAVLTK